jgi:hypothetical protein
MHQRTLALIVAAALFGAGCASKETKTEAAPPPAAAPAPAPAPVASKPECAPEPTGKKKSTKTKSSKKADQAAAVDCEPAKAKGATPPPAAAEPAPAPAKDAGKASEPGKPRIVKSRDGSFEGEIYGNIPAGSKWSRLQIGMEQPEVERILGVTHEVRHTPTGKAYMPFYYGTDRYRNEHVYRGQGSVSYTSGGSWGNGRGVLMMINYDPNI